MNYLETLIEVIFHPISVTHKQFDTIRVHLVPKLSTVSEHPTDISYELTSRLVLKDKVNVAHCDVFLYIHNQKG